MWPVVRMAALLGHCRKHWHFSCVCTCAVRGHVCACMWVLWLKLSVLGPQFAALAAKIMPAKSVLPSNSQETLQFGNPLSPPANICALSDSDGDEEGAKPKAKAKPKGQGKPGRPKGSKNQSLKRPAAAVEATPPSKVVKVSDSGSGITPRTSDDGSQKLGASPTLKVASGASGASAASGSSQSDAAKSPGAKKHL